MSDKWQRIIDSNVDFAEKQMRETGYVGAMFVLGTSDTYYILPADFSDSRVKMATYNVVRTACLAYNAQSLTTITEAWMRSEVRRDNETQAEFENRTINREDRTPIAELPGRIEVVLIVLSYREQGERHCRQAMRRIVRDENNNFVKLARLVDDNDTASAGGEITSLLPIYPPSEPVQKLAQQQMLRYGVKLDVL